MNEIKIKVKFKKGLCYSQGIKLVQNDYNSTKLVFEFDDNEGTKIFELKDSDDNVIFADEIVNNELILARFDEQGKAYPIFTKEGEYVYEVSLYKDNSKLTSAYDKFKVNAEQVVIDGEIVETYTPMFDNLLSDLSSALQETDNIDIDVNKVGNIATVSITKKDGTEKSVPIIDGLKGDKGDKGADAKINGVNTLTIEAGDNITLEQEGSTLTINSTGGGSGGISNYEELENQPKVNNVTLIGNKSLNDLGIQPVGDYVTYIKSKNICDTEIEEGSLSSTTGVPISSSTKTRTKNFISVLPNTQYTFTDYAEEALNVAIYGYDSNEIFIGSITNKGPSSHYKTFTTQNNCAYIKFWVLSNDTSQKYQIEPGTESTNYVVPKTMNVKESDLSPELAEKINNSSEIKMNYLYVDSTYDSSTEGYGTTRFSNIYDANVSIVDNSKDNQYTIFVADGTYTDLQEKYSGSTGSDLEGVIVKDYVYYIGNEKNPSNCIISWDGATGLTNPLYSDVTRKAPFHITNVINKSLHTKISGFKIDGINLRYAIHIETSSVGGDAEWEISDMVIDWKGIPGAPTQESLRGTNGYKPAIGAGHSPNEKGIIKNCNIKSALPSISDPIGIGYLGHNNYNYSGYNSEIVSGANITIENVNFNNSKISLLTTRDPEQSPSITNTPYVLNLKNVTNLEKIEQTSSFGIYAWNVKWLEKVTDDIKDIQEDLTNYYRKTETYTQTEINNLISAISTMDKKVVQTLPVEDISTTTIYLVPNASSEENNIYDEYIYISSNWEHIGSTKVDLTNYVTNTNYANNTTGGVFKTSSAYGQSITSGGQLFAVTKTYSEYSSANNAMFISKGTLENVLRGYGIID